MTGPTGARWTVRIDPDRCAGSGLCVGVAPGHFIYSGGASRPSVAAADPSDDILAAAECCPMEAISVVDVRTGHPVFTESEPD